MKDRTFRAPFFNHFTQLSPPLLNLNVDMLSRGVNSFAIKNEPIPLWLAPLMMTLKSPLTYMLL